MRRHTKNQNFSPLTTRLSLNHQHRWPAGLSQKAIFASSRSASEQKTSTVERKWIISSLVAVQVLFFLFRVVVLYAGSLVFRCFLLVERDLLVLSARTHSRLRWRKREVSQMSHNMFASVLKSRSLYSVVESSSPGIVGLLIEIWIDFFPALCRFCAARCWKARRSWKINCGKNKVKFLVG